MKLAIDRAPRRMFGAATPLLALALVAAGCGGSSNSSNASTSASAYTNGNGGATRTAAAATGAAVTTKSAAKLGTILAGQGKKTIYLFEADKGNKSTCDGACAGVWPPVTTDGAPDAGTGVKASLLGTTTRADGTKQVTYDGHPLYYYASDGDAGDTYGQDINSYGAAWYVVSPSGNKVEKGGS